MPDIHVRKYVTEDGIVHVHGPFPGFSLEDMQSGKSFVPRHVGYERNEPVRVLPWGDPTPISCLKCLMRGDD